MAVRESERYYIEGSVVRKREVEYARPRREERPVPRKKAKTYTRAARKAENSLGFDKAYTVVLTIMVLVMIAACVIMLSVQGGVEAKEDHIDSMRRELQQLQVDNSAFENSLNNMYSLEDIYKVATGELGMVYSQNGQIKDYDKEMGDYVKQYTDVPKTSD